MSGGCLAFSPVQIVATTAAVVVAVVVVVVVVVDLGLQGRSR